MKRLTILIICISLFIGGTTWAAGLFSGYAGMPWDADVTKVTKVYRKGSLGTLYDQVIYKQLQPNKDIRQRSFAFKDNKLFAVTVSFAPEFVNKIGLEHLLALHQKAYGTGQMDRRNAPHLISYIWENEATKITFAYAPRKPEYTVLMYQKK
jgi:hypothetical protein